MLNHALGLLALAIASFLGWIMLPESTPAWAGPFLLFLTFLFLGGSAALCVPPLRRWIRQRREFAATDIDYVVKLLTDLLGRHDSADEESIVSTYRTEYMPIAQRNYTQAKRLGWRYKNRALETAIQNARTVGDIKRLRVALNEYARRLWAPSLKVR
jgi:hypothetical protein